jgi:hypothetical protein
LFVELDDEQPWPKEERVPGYYGLILTSLRKPVRLDHDAVWGWQMLVRSGEFDDKRPEPATAKRGKFAPANDAGDRRRMLAEHFAGMIGRDTAEEIILQCAGG